MGRAFSRAAAEPDWVRAAHDWIRERVRESGRTVIGDPVLSRVRPWSVQFQVPSDTGRLWFKANVASMAFEPRLQETLARLVPDDVDAPLAIDADRGWMLTVDRGTTLGDSRQPTTADWCRVVERIARLQRRLAAHRDELLAAGMPDCGPEAILDRFDRLIEVLGDLPPDHPAHVAPDLAADLAAARPRLAQAVVTLQNSRLPTTWQHGDAHPWNVFATDDGLRLFDFGDSQWAHALEVLRVPHGWISEHPHIAWPEVERTYAEVWDVEPDEIADGMAAAALTHPVNRTLTWWWCLRDATAAEWHEWGEAPVYHLRGVLGRGT